MKPGLRDNFFLAKIAGEDVDIGTLRPGTAASEREELLLKIADRIDSSSKPYASKEKIKDYFYSMTYDDLDYEYAKEYFKHKAMNIFGCSSIASGKYFIRNYDWLYDNTAEFYVTVPRKGNRYASHGVAAGLPELTDEFVSSNKYSPLYKIVPFMMLDGINEYSLTVSMNVVPLDKGATTKTVPLVEERDSICAIMLIRYILDNFKSAYEAAEYIRDYVSVYMPKSLQDKQYEVHLLIKDKYDTGVMEFINNEVVMSFDNAITNFYVSDFAPGTDDDEYKVYTPSTGNAVEENNITPHGSGLERYNVICDWLAELEDAPTLEKAVSLAKSLAFTYAYDKHADGDESIPEYYSEFVGIYSDGTDLTLSSSAEEFLPYVKMVVDLYKNRTRDNSLTWQTVHSSIYDLETKDLYVATQESWLNGDDSPYHKYQLADSASFIPIELEYDDEDDGAIVSITAPEISDEAMMQYIIGERKLNDFVLYAEESHVGTYIVPISCFCQEVTSIASVEDGYVFKFTWYDGQNLLTADIKRDSETKMLYVDSNKVKIKEL